MSDLPMEQLNYSDLQAFDVLVKYRRMHLHIHNVHEFFYCYEGSGEQLVSSGIEKMKKDDLFFFPAGDPHRGSGSKHEDCVGSVVNFGDNFFFQTLPGEQDYLTILQLLKQWVKERNHCLPLSATASTKIRNLIQQMTDECKKQDVAYKGALKNLAMQLLLVIIREGHFPPTYLNQFKSNDNKERIAYICAYIERNFMQKLTVAEIINTVGMSRSHFHAEFIKYTGLTMVQFLNKVRCENAIKMLKAGNETTEEIAQHCGFGSLCSFYRILRKETGIRPSQLRQN